MVEGALVLESGNFDLQLLFLSSRSSVVLGIQFLILEKKKRVCHPPHKLSEGVTVMLTGESVGEL